MTDSASTNSIDPDLLDVLRCPVTRSRLRQEGDFLVAEVGGLSYPVREGIPVMLAEEARLPLEFALIRNHYIGRTFIQPTQSGRDEKVKIKYNAVKEVLVGKSVVMVDDSIVRGTTTRGLVALVRAAGAREVHLRVSSPPITGPCYYGIDTPTREELIAANFTVDEIAGKLGVDTLAYLSLDGMLRAVPKGPEGFCHACFSGDYPTAPPSDPVKLRLGR